MKVNDAKIRNVRRIVECRIMKHNQLLNSKGQYNNIYKETLKNQYMYIHTSLTIMLLLGVITKADYQDYMKKLG